MIESVGLWCKERWRCCRLKSCQQGQHGQTYRAFPLRAPLSHACFDIKSIIQTSLRLLQQPELHTWVVLHAAGAMPSHRALPAPRPMCAVLTRRLAGRHRGRCPVVTAAGTPPPEREPSPAQRGLLAPTTQFPSAARAYEAMRGMLKSAYQARGFILGTCVHPASTQCSKPRALPPPLLLPRIPLPLPAEVWKVSANCHPSAAWGPGPEGEPKQSGTLRAHGVLQAEVGRE